MRLVLRLFVLVAVLLMPFGMAGASATVAHHATTSMPMSHCPEPTPTQDRKGGFAECTMACATALPAVDSRAGEPMRIVCTPVRPAAAERLNGLHPDTATPPPKPS
jgi:hypothetical protein